MKLIQCIIQPYKLDEVVDALQDVASGMTISDAQGYGHQKGHSMLYRGHELIPGQPMADKHRVRMLGVERAVTLERDG